MATRPEPGRPAARWSSWRAFAGSPALGWVLVAAGVALRIAWVLSVDPELVKDSGWYFSHALDIAEGRGYQDAGHPTAYWPVGYPALLGAAFRLFGSDLMVGRLLNVALAAVTLSCMLVVARRVTGSPIAANLAVLLFAVYPTDIGYTSLILSEPLFNALVLGGVACIVALRPHAAGLVAAGLCFGLAAYTRAHGLLLPALIGIGVLPLAGGAWKRSLVRVAAMYLALAATLAPWWIRNASAFGAFVPVSTNGGVNLYIGNNPHATGGYRFDMAVRAPLLEVAPKPWWGGPAEVEFDRAAGALARRYILEHPGSALALWPAKLAELFGSEWQAFHWNRVPAAQSGRVIDLRSAGLRFYPILWLLALLGLAASELGRRTRHVRIRAPLLAAGLAIAVPGLSWWMVPLAAALGWLAVRDGPPPRLLHPWLAPALIAGVTLVQLVYFGAGRYHHVMMPWVAILAGAFLALPFGLAGKPTGRRQAE